MAMSGRVYTMSFTNVTISAVQDALALYAGASKIFGVTSVNLGQVTGTTVANARVRLRYLPPTVTSGASGSAGTIKPWVPGDAAPTVTGRINDTSQATSSGTAVDLWDDVWNTVNGFVWSPALVMASHPPVIGLSGAFIVSIDTALASLVCNGSVTFEELP
jgi:hypothetical protein